jgi:hypothetical protein
VKALAIVAVLAAPTAAHAECSWSAIDSILRPGVRVTTLCEPCGERVPDVPQTLESFTVVDEVRLNGRSHDPASVYVQTTPDHFTNLALLVGCPVAGVSPTLQVTHDDRGELITPSLDGGPPTTAGAYARPAPEAPVPWGLLVAFGGLAFGVPIGLLLRRKPAQFEPRAVALVPPDA